MSVSRLAWTLFGGFYLGFFLPQLALLFRLAGRQRLGSFVLVVIMAGDTSAYFVGNDFGKKEAGAGNQSRENRRGSDRICDRQRVMAGLPGWKFILTVGELGEIVVICTGLSVLGQLGDLFESWIKRVFAVKDSGELFPGHGGVLDRLDSLIFPAVFTTRLFERSFIHEIDRFAWFNRINRRQHLGAGARISRSI